MREAIHGLAAAIAFRLKPEATKAQTRDNSSMSKLARFAWAVLAYNVAVILWGAYVRATGSGAGCGAHWPLCNGEVLPRAAGVATLIEFSHRATSGLALLAVAALVAGTFRTCRAGHPARAGAVMSGILILSEAAVGAGLVLFQLVADNATMARAMFMVAHLLNTFLLLAALTLTAWWLTVGVPFAADRRARAYLATGCAALLVAGASGAVAALGDTLFPAQSLAASLRDDLSFTSHLLIRLRIFHPVLAVVAAAVVGMCTARLGRSGPAPNPRGVRAVIGMAIGQIALGFFNVIMLAPVWLQLVHLLVADALWIGFLLLGAYTLTDRAAAPARAQAA
jgi:heme A synthase